MRKKILFITTGLGEGGAERALFNLLSSGLAEEFDCMVVSLADKGVYGDRIKELGIPVVALGLKPGRISFEALRKLLILSHHFSPDLIQGWMYHGNLVAWMIKKLLGRKVILCWGIHHSVYSLEYEKKLTQFVIKAGAWVSSEVDAIIYVSRISKRQHESIGFSKSRGLVIPNGIDVERFKSDRFEGVRLRRELNIPMNAFVVGHVARFHPMKDHRSFIEASIKLLECWNNLYFIMCGKDVTWDNEEFVLKIPEERRKHFSFLGERSDVERIYRAMDLFCSSSYSEGFPNVIGEAMASGVPCVVTDVGDSSYIVGNTGVVVPPKDPEALAQGIEKILRMSIRERFRIGRLARERILKNFSINKIVYSYLKLCRSLLVG